MSEYYHSMNIIIPFHPALERIGVRRPCLKKPIGSTMSKDILFDDSEEKPSKAPRKPLGKIIGGLSARSKLVTSMPIFGDPATLFPERHPPATQPAPTPQTAPSPDTVQEFVKNAPELSKYVTLVRNTAINLTPKQRHEASVRSAITAQLSINTTNRLADHLQQQIRARKNEAGREIRSFLPKKFDTFERKAHVSFYRDLNAALFYRLENCLCHYSFVCLRIGELVHLIQTHPEFDLFVRFAVLDVETWLANFETTDSECIRLAGAILRTKRDLLIRPLPSDPSRCLEIAQSLFDPATLTFPDHGVAEGLFAEVVERDQAEKVAKRFADISDQPDCCGRLLLAIGRDALRCTDAQMPLAFLLASRYVFGELYRRRPVFLASPDYVHRLMEMKRFSSQAFNINENFLPAKFRSIPLEIFPTDNPYQEAIDFLVVAGFHCSPIDFCNVIHKALSIIQQIASDISWKGQQERTGKVVAKSPHLLAFDDLFDIALIVFLLAEPGMLQPIVQFFKPFIDGLELTAELNWAFTQIAALVEQIETLDFEKFLAEARDKRRKAAEVDPLNILA
jgi:hypothetical protein